jgi:hypothetical protein
MKKMKMFLTSLVLFVAIFVAAPANAQVKLEDLKDLNIQDILGKTKILTVRKGFSPVFNLGNFQVNKVGILGEKLKGVGILGDIFQTKGIDKVIGLYKTYKTGLVVFKILSAAGTVVGTISAVKGFTAENKFNNSTVKTMLYPAVASLATGIITKLITKAASYKAVDIFNGVVKNKIKDIFSIKPASNTVGVGLYVKL